MLSKRSADALLHVYGRARSLLPGILRRPLGVFLYITAGCNLNCSYCWQRADDSRKDEWVSPTGRALTPEEWARVVERLPRPCFLGISGGEPTISRAFGPILRAARRRGIPVTLNTNGLTLEDPAVRRLILEGAVRNVSVSLDGFAPLHDAGRNLPGLFDRVVAGLKALRAEEGGRGSLSLTIKTVLLDANLEDLPRFRDFCAAELGAKTLNVSFAKQGDHAQFSLKHCDVLPEIFAPARAAGLHPYADPARVVNVLSDMLDRNASSPCEMVLYPQMRSRSGIAAFLDASGRGVYGPCRLPWALNAVLPDGEVIPCLSLGVGNVRDHGYQVTQAVRTVAMQGFLDAIDGAGSRLPEACTACCFARVGPDAPRGGAA